MKYFLLSFVSLLISILILMNTISLPSLKSEDAPLDEFSATRAMKVLNNIAQKPHPIETEENEKVRNYLVEQLKDLGLEPQLNSTYSKNGNREGNITNIIARLEGSANSNDAILLVSHYDSVKYGPGAADAGSCVATIIETVRALKNEETLINDIIILITDGEEEYLLGAKAFVDEHPYFNDAKLVVNLEARGNSGIVTMFETGEGNSNIIGAMKKSVPHPFAFSATYEVYKQMPNGTDFTEFRNKGLNGLNFANINGAHTYHEPTDNIENYNKKTLQYYGTTILNLMRYLGNADLDKLNDTEIDSVYFTLTKNIFINYSAKIAIPLSIFTILLLIVLTYIAYKKGKIKIFKVILGTGMNLITLLLTYLLTKGLFSLTNRGACALNNFESRTYKWNMFFITPKNSNTIMLLYLIITTILLVLIIKFINKYINYMEIYLGNLVLWSVIMMFTSIYIKGASYLFTWTTLVFILSMLTILVFEKSKYKHIINFTSLFANMFAGINVYLLFIYLIYLCVFIFMSPVIMVLISLYGIVIISKVLELTKNNTNIDKRTSVEIS
ncbi:M28 family peptidase [Oceanirhabdus sp. W0125-5]|uniref:M28 family peptidase n=1 Tax=Oceanirhabdus sp. W0125-5 TaxID=2999116 RepID=UPI0022F32E2C|nr:M28 family peptidase [Oceanirhabdus sp. W0125-5]WBW99727.1 M28 family peptidase [Oceanirhabdus sp. W0125-5]